VNPPGLLCLIGELHKQKSILCRPWKMAVTFPPPAESVAGHNVGFLLFTVAAL
jgi:hypothetical protein